MTDWYRTVDWDDAARADFEERLSRSRSSRAQYLKIKALTLQDAGLLHEAEGLYRRMLAEHPGDFFEVEVLEHLADLARTQGRLEEADLGYRRVLAHPDARSRGSGMVEVSLADVPIDRGLPAQAARRLRAAANDGLVMETVTAFYANFFRFHRARARAASLLGDAATAADAAQSALSVVGAPNQYSRHPGVGAVNADEQTLRELEALVPRLGGPRRNSGIAQS